MENSENGGNHKHATAKIVLDYVKVFIWPAVILFAIIIFKSQMENILGACPRTVSLLRKS